MLKLLFIGIAVLIALPFLLLFLVLVPLMLLGGLIKLLFFAVLIPFRIVGFAIGAVGTAFGLLLKIGLVAFSLLAAAALLAGGVLLTSLLPLLLIALGAWLLVKLFARPSAATT